jgi:hypothetical protein
VVRTKAAAVLNVTILESPPVRIDPRNIEEKSFQARSTFLVSPRSHFTDRRDFSKSILDQSSLMPT